MPVYALNRRAVASVGLGLLVVLVGGITFLESTWLPADAVLAIVAGLVVLLGVAMSRPMSQGLAAWWPYWLFLGVVVSGAIRVSSPAAWLEVSRDVLFVLLVIATARLSDSSRARMALLGILVTLLSLVLIQVTGPAIETDTLGRGISYASLMQWSGFPELGLLACMGMCGAGGLALASDTWPLRGAAATLAIAFVVAAFVMYSRSALATMLVVTLWLTLVAIAGGWRRKRAARAVGCVLLGFTLMYSTPLDLSAQAEPPSDAFEVRSQGWRVALSMLRDHPWLGVGPGMYPLRYADYSPLEDSSHAYNLVLHTSAELGVVGLIAYLLMWWRVVGASLKAAVMGRERAFGLGLHGVLVAFFVRSQSEHFLANLTTSFRLLLLLGIVFGLSEAWRAAQRSDAPPSDQHEHRSPERRDV